MCTLRCGSLEEHRPGGQSLVEATSSPLSRQPDHRDRHLVTERGRVTRAAPGQAGTQVMTSSKLVSFCVQVIVFPAVHV